MAEKRFFDLLKEKMSALRPSEQHRDEDWAALGDRLNLALPERRRQPRRALVLPLLLLAAFLMSNAAWWQSHRQHRAAMDTLEKQIVTLQSSLEAQKTARLTLRTDTIWRTVYVREPLAFQPVSRSQRQSASVESPDLPFDLTTDAYDARPEPNKAAPAGTAEARAQAPVLSSAAQVAGFPLLATPGLVPLQRPVPRLSPIRIPADEASTDDQAINPTGKNWLDAIRPKYFKVGASFGWMMAGSPGLMHEGGFSGSVEGLIGLSRHWGLTARYSAGQLHYKGHEAAAVLGAPALPDPGYGQHLSEVDVTGQKFRQFDLGLRYTFSRPGKPRPFVGLSWGNLVLLPYTVEYELRYEPSGNIQKAVFSVEDQTRLRNLLRLGTGVEIPLSPRFDLTLEGAWQRPWKKPHRLTPDLLGIQGGLYWLF